jgi:hypothetical protein
MACGAVIRVLLAGEEPREFLLSRQPFRRNHRQCYFANSAREIAALLIATEFDLVLATHKISGASIHQLVALLSGSRASMSYSLRVEEGHWRLPVLMLGKECLGTPALRGGEFVRFLDQLLMQIKSTAAAALP